jgi:hypothetical protein
MITCCASERRTGFSRQAIEQVLEQQLEAVGERQAKHGEGVGRPAGARQERKTVRTWIIEAPGKAMTMNNAVIIALVGSQRRSPASSTGRI